MRQFFLFLLASILAQVESQCGTGCKSCYQSSKCIECYPLFQLDSLSGICNYKNCFDNLYFQQKTEENKGQCQSICDEGYIKNEQSKICERLENCSQTYTLQTGISIDEDIKQIIPFGSDRFLILYQSKINIIEQKTGKFLQSIPLKSNSSTAQIFENDIYLILLDNSIEKWIIDFDQVLKFDYKADGKVDQTTEIVQYNKSFGLLVTQDKKSQQIYIRILIDRINKTFVNFNSFVKVLYTNTQTIKIYHDMVFIISTNGITIQKLILDNQNQLTLQQYTNQDLCTNLNLEDILQIIYIKVQNQYLLLFKQKKFYIVIDQTKCIQNTLSDIPSKLYEMQFNQSYYYILHLVNQIQVLDDKLSKIFDIVDNNNQFVDSILINIQDQYLILVILNDKFQLKFYMFNKITKQFNLIFTQQLNITAATKIQIISQTQNEQNINYFQLLVFTRNIQSITLNVIDLNKIEILDTYLLKSFQRKNLDMTSTVNAISMNTDLNILTECSKDGNIMVWDTSLILQPRIIDSSVINNYGQCLSLKHITQYNQLILFQNKTLVYDALRSKIIKFWNFTNTQSKQTNRFIFSLGDYAFLIQDSCLLVVNLQYEDVLKDCSVVFDDIIKNILLDSSYYLIIQKQKILYVYFIDLVSPLKSLKEISNYQSLSNISFCKIRNFSSAYKTDKNILFEINVYFEDQSFMIFDQKLNQIHFQQKIPLSYVIDISFVISDSYDTFYAILGFSSQKSASLKFQVYVVFKGQDKFYSAIQSSSGSKVFPITKTINAITGISEYDIKISYVLSYLTVTQSFYWSIQKTDNIIQDVFLAQGVFMNQFTQTKQGQFFIFGDTRGLTTVSLTKRKYYTKTYEISQTELNNQDYIKEVQQSLVLKKYFIISSSITVYNIFTNVQEDKIVISKSQTQIKYFKILEANKIIICVKDSIIFLKNYSNNDVKQFSSLQTINGIITQKENIIAYGSQIVLLTFDLSILYSQSQDLDNSTAQQCIAISQSLVCKMLSSTIFLYDKTTLDTIKTFQTLQQDQSFLLQVDLVEERIFLFSLNIEVYSFSGILLQYIQSINEKISSLSVYDFDIAIIIPSYIKIFDRKTLTYRGSIISPGGGQIVRIGFIKQLNQLVLYSNTARFGQIFTYSLLSLSSVMSYKSTFSQNEPSLTADFMYDKDQNYFIHLDLTGNFQLIDYSGQFVIYHLVKILEYDSSSDLLILGMSLDFRNNNLFIYSQSKVFNLCYGDLSNSLIRFQQSKKKLFTEITETNDLGNDYDYQINTFIIAGDNGLLYKYFDTKFQYFDQLNEEILSVKFVIDQKVLVIALSQQFIVFKNIDRNSIQNKTSLQNQKEFIQIENTFSRFICDDIFQLKNQTIYHFDFVNQKYLKTIQFQDITLRITKFICSTYQSSLILGLNNGSIMIYDKKKLELNTISLVQVQQGQQYNNFEIGHLSETSKDIWVCFASSQGIFKIPKDQYTSKQILKFEDIEKFKLFNEISSNIFQVDEINNKLFLSFIGEKLVRVYSIQTEQAVLQTYLSLPNKLFNQLLITPQHLLVYSGFHVMIYDRVNLNYIQRIRRQNNLDSITQIFVIGNRYILLFFNNKYEMFSIEDDKEESTLMDQLTLTDPTLIKYSVSGGESQIQNSKTNVMLQVIGFTKNSVFEQRYSLVYEGMNAVNKKCSMNIEVSSFLEMTQSMSSIKLLILPDPTSRYVNMVSDTSLNNYWMVQLKNESLNTVNFKDTLHSLMQVFPIKQSPLKQKQEINQSLKIDQNSFQIFIKEEINIRDFYFNFTINSGKIEFWQQSQQIIFHNIQIMKQKLSDISFQFKNMKKVVLNQIYFSELLRERRNDQDDNFSPSFLYFENCGEVYLYNLTLSNENLRKSTFDGLIYAKNVNKLVIKNLQIYESQVSNLIQFIQIKQLIIENVKVMNCNADNILLSTYESNYVFQIIGVQYSELYNLTMVNNINLSFILTNMEYKDDEKSMKYIVDQILIQNIQIFDNQIIFSKKQSLVRIRNSLININHIQYSNNQGNIQISDSLNLVIQNGILKQNQCLDGGSLAIYSSMNKIELKDIEFSNNKAYASGGAIYFENIQAKIIMEQSSVLIKENQALIGGGVRLYNTKTDLEQSLQFNYQKIITNNIAELYGNNFATFLEVVNFSLFYKQDGDDLDYAEPVKFEIKQFDELNSSEQQIWQIMSNITNFMSGSNLRLKLQLVDSEGTILKFSNDTLKQKKYPESIMDELLNIQFKVEAMPQSQNVLISGQNVISIEQFDLNSNSFLFQDTILTSRPNSTSFLEIVCTYTPTTSIIRKPIHIQVQLRNCIVGEVIKIINQDTYSCFSCPLGFYSLSDPTKDKFWVENIQNTQTSMVSVNDKSECLKCPDSAYSCINKQIKLKKGYWRESEISNQILQCESLFNACDSQTTENKNGCLEGYIGPICKECDTIGSVWNHRYSKSFTDELKCNRCGSQNQQIAFVILTIVALVLYFMVSIIFFMNSFFHQNLCQYLRIMKILPISKNAIKDQSSFYLKILINYIQISSALMQFQISFLPDIFSSIPRYIGLPSDQLIVSINCIIGVDYIKQYGRSHVIQVIQAIIPLFFFMLLILLVSLCEKLKLFQIRQYHKYTLINFIFVFFQPDQINFFSKQLTCYNIGDKQYVASDLQISCDDHNYNNLTYSISIPLIIFWSSIPILIFNKLRLRSNFLQTCYTRYYFGYYYSEYKLKNYYWEFIRIYLRVFIVVVFTLTYSQSLISYQIIILVLFIYIVMAIQYNPFRNRILSKFDIFSYLIIMINSVLTIINFQMDSYLIQLSQYFLHVIFTLWILFVIGIFKLSNPYSILGKYFNSLLKNVLPQILYKKYQSHTRVNFRTFLLWRKVYINLNNLINQQTIEKVNKAKSTYNPTFCFMNKSKKYTILQQ